MVAPLVYALLGTWLLVSAFFWPHTGAQTTNALVCGGLAVMLAVSGLEGFRPARALLGLVGLWLFLSALVLPRFVLATAVNHAAAGAAMVLLAVMGVPRGPLEGVWPRWGRARGRRTPPGPPTPRPAG